MNNTIEYKGYKGSIEYSEMDGLFYGKVQDIPSLISYEGKSIKELISDFYDSIDDYMIVYTQSDLLPSLPSTNHLCSRSE